MKNIANKPYDEREWIYRQSDDKKNRFLLGKRGEKTAIIRPIITERKTENQISFMLEFFASSFFFAPKSWLIIIPIALPEEIKTTLKTLLRVETIFTAATTSRPLIL